MSQDKAAKELMKAEAKAAKAAEKSAARAAKDEAKEARNAALAKQKAELSAQAGPETGRAVFGGKTVVFFKNGYVSLSMFGGGTPEKLLAVDVNVDVSKKTGLGRLVVGVATVGLNVATTSNMRGDIWVSLTTERQTHMLHQTPPSESTVKSARKLEALAKACIALSETKVSGPGPVATLDLASQLEKLQELRDSGALSDEEFRNAKSKLLS